MIPFVAVVFYNTYSKVTHKIISI